MYRPIPEPVLLKIEVRWPHLRTLCTNYRASIGTMREPQIGKAICENALRGATGKLTALEVWHLSHCTLGADGGGYGHPAP